MKTICKIKMSEKKDILNIEKDWDALKTVQASMEKTDLSNEEFALLKKIVKDQETLLKNKKENWWLNICDSYQLDKNCIERYVLIFSNNEICM
ncbi:hypothetical protein [Clostridium perfringens]|uniref:hypothetical protein n=1 Tax=Clostridium perfringens TaxID=1502 RepID=UPI00103B71B4|nr:hypothetical protein [Clostridium perfringens]TBX05602.1 hypothetical protein BFS03_13370 [Clostridium perfringens]